MAQILDGTALSSILREEMRKQVDLFQVQGTPLPGLGVVLVGDDPASKVYVEQKKKACKAVGFFSTEIKLPASITQEELIDTVKTLNNDSRIHGFLVQMPVPKHINIDAVIDSIDPAKDVDGVHPLHLGRLFAGNEMFAPCTPLGIIEILKRYNIPIEGKNVLIIGRSNTVGKPVALLFLRENATVTTAHSKTIDLAGQVAKSDIVVAAIGKPRFVKGEWLKPGAVVIDVGINSVPDASKPSGHRLVGDVDFDAAKERASWITPVPGGIGPMTISLLLLNTLKARNNILSNL